MGEGECGNEDLVSAVNGDDSDIREGDAERKRDDGK